MAGQLSYEQARAQAWEMLLAKARAAQDAAPEAVAAAKTLLEDATWKETIEAGVTASPAPSASSDTPEPTLDPSPAELANQIIAAFAHDPSALAGLSDADIDALAQQAAQALLSGSA